MAWNLVEELSIPGSRRAFYLPLAAIPPGRTTVRSVSESQFDVTDDRVNQNDPFFNIPDDPAFHIRITPQRGDEGDLPDPAYRLHAMAPGYVRFKPQDAQMNDRLILEMPMFLTSVNVPWWDRWRQAGWQWAGTDRSGLVGY